jgi:hypothetical protein
MSISDRVVVMPMVRFEQRTPLELTAVEKPFRGGLSVRLIFWKVRYLPVESRTGDSPWT